MPRLSTVTKDVISYIKYSLEKYELTLRMYTSEAIRYQARNEYVALMEAFQSLNRQFKLLEEDMSLETYEKLPEMLDTLFKTSSVLHDKCEEVEMLSDVSSFALETKDQIKKTIANEKKALEQNEAHDLAELNNAEVLSRATSQKRLKEVAKVRTSGYGYIYDTMPLLFEQIDNDADLKRLAGSKNYNELKDAVNAFRVLAKNRVDGNARISESDRPELEKVKTAIGKFSDEVNKYTRAFEQMTTMLNGEVNSLLESCNKGDTALWSDKLNGQPTITPETARNYHRQVVDEILQEDENELKLAYKDSSREAESRPGQLMTIYNGLDESLASLSQNNAPKANVVFADMTQARNLVYMDLRGKGFEEVSIRTACQENRKTEGEAIKNSVINETCKEILDLASTSDVNKIDDKISDIYVNSMIACEEEFRYMLNDPTKEGIIKASFQLKPFSDFYKMEMPKYGFLENGDPLVKASIDRKLKALGKPYSFDQMTSLVKAFGNISDNEAGRITKAGELSFTDSVNLTSKIRVVSEAVSAANKAKTIADFVATVPTNIDQMVSSHNMQYDDKTAKASSIRDARYLLGIRTADGLAEKMKTEISDNGASKKFASVYDLTRKVALLESLDANQDAINFLYGQLKQSCTKYLQSRNPSSTSGKERYKLVAQINDMVDGSARFRKELAKKMPKREEHDIIDAGRTFVANTHSVFGDSKKMTNIKSIVNKLSKAQMVGMNIPAVGGSINYLELFKACVDYITDPKKAENQRKHEVSQLMLKVAQKINNPKIIEIANMANEIESRPDVAKALSEYERKVPAIKPKEVIGDNTKNNLIHTELPVGFRLRFHKKQIESEYFIDGFFGMKIKPNEDIKQGYAKTPESLDNKEGFIRNLPDIEISKDEFEKANLDPQVFPYLALMDYAVNTYAAGRTEYVNPTEKDEKSNFVFFIHNFDGGEVRQDIEKILNPECNIKNAREHAQDLIKNASKKEKFNEIAELLAKGLKYLKPNVSGKENITNIDIISYSFIGRYLDLVSKNPKLMDAIYATNHINEKDIVLMKGCAQAAEICVKATEAKSKVVQAMYQGKELSKEEMIACKKAMVKGDMLAAERKHMKLTYDKMAAESHRMLEKKAKEYFAKIQKALDDSLDTTKTEEQRAEARALHEKLEHGKLTFTNGLYKDMLVDTRTPALLASLGTQKGRDYFDQYVNELDLNQVTMDELTDLITGKKNCMNEFNNFLDKTQDQAAPKQEEANKKEDVIDTSSKKVEEEAKKAPVMHN